MQLKLKHPHAWDVTPQQAKDIQLELRNYIDLQDRLGTINYVAGIDVGFEKNNTVTRAAIAVLRFPELELCDQSIARLPTTFPYIPGYLSFREVPAVLKAFAGLRQAPDLLLCDGQGIAHPRRLGIAAHLGVITDLPSIGVAKSRLIGTHDEVGEEKGSWVPLMDKGECIGAVLRTRTGVKPLYISAGHRICLETSIDYVMRCLTRYRLPETTRWAHRLASG